MDVTDRRPWRRRSRTSRTTEGRVDVLVNNAGIQRVGLTETFDPATWELVVQTHLMGTFHCSAMAIRSMREHGGGAIVQVASVAGLIALPGRGPYSAAKAAMMSLSRVMAVEVADLGIRVNAVAPGMARTAIVEEGIANGSIRLDTMLPEIPMRRLATTARHRRGRAVPRVIGRRLHHRPDPRRRWRLVDPGHARPARLAAERAR